MTVIERIKEISKNKGWNLQKTATEAGIGINTIYKWKSQTPKIDAISKVANVLGVSVDYLLGNTDDMHANKKADTSSDDLKEYFDEHPVLKFDGKEIPEAEMKIIKRILEDMDD